MCILTHIVMICLKCSETEGINSKGLCKRCNRQEQSKRYYIKNKEKIKAKRREAYKKNPEKTKKANKIYIDNNKEKVKKSLHSYYERNKEKLLEYHKKYREKNKDKRTKQRKKYEQKRRKNAEFKLRKAVSNAVYCAILRGGGVKGGSILDNLPYSIIELKKHIESQFEPWMNWENWGVYNPETWDDNDDSTWTWHIDHIVPQCNFPYSSMEDNNFKKCWALSNLRPYSAKHNVKETRRIK